MSGPFLDVCTLWAPVIHSVSCSDPSSFSSSISVSATRVKIKEGSGGAEERSRERRREREKKKRKRKISKQSRNSACRKYRNCSTGLIKNAVDVQPVWVTAWDCRICTILRICTVISPGS